MDEQDPLRHFRSQFLFPKTKSGNDAIYFCGNSLGLQPIKTKTYVNQELSDWANFGVHGHHEAKHAWLPYHEFLTDTMAKHRRCKTHRNCGNEYSYRQFGI